MSRTWRIVISILTILQSYVLAQAPACVPGYSWSYNSLNQTPCTMTVALGGACNNGSEVYLGPTQSEANPCRCSTVFYSLLSACALCQNQGYLDWSGYDLNCTTVYNQVFPDPIPSAIRVPHYAYLDVETGNQFNFTAAESAGGTDSTAGPQPTGSSTTSGSSTIASATPTVSPASETKKSTSNAGAIAGGVVGGLAFLAILTGIAFILRRRKRSRPSSLPYRPSSAAENAFGSPETGQYNIPASVGSRRLYNPDDPSTFPTNSPIDSVGYSTYTSSPDANHRGPVINPTFTGNTTSSTPVF